MAKKKKKRPKISRVHRQMVCELSMTGFHVVGAFKHAFVNEALRKHGEGLTEQERLIVRAIGSDLNNLMNHLRNLSWHLDTSKRTDFPQKRTAPGHLPTVKRARKDLIAYLRAPRVP